MLKALYMGTYNYIPSIPAAAVFIAIFIITTITHFWQVTRTRTWFFIPFAIGGISCNLLKSVSEAVLILVAPSLFAASIYMELGRIMLATGGERYSIIRRSWLTKIFVVGDAFSFLVQAAGASMLVKVSTANNGGNIIKIGLIIQIVFFALFVVTSIIFHVRMNRNGASYQHFFPLRKHQLVLYFGSGLIFVRCIFRLIEYEAGDGSTLLQHEYYSYIFDAALMVLVMMTFSLVYPNEIGQMILNTNDSLGSDSTTITNCVPQATASVSVKAGNATVDVGTMTGSELYTGISQALGTICPTVMQTTEWTNCAAELAMVEKLPYIDAGLMSYGSLYVTLCTVQEVALLMMWKGLREEIHKTILMPNRTPQQFVTRKHLLL
ncbi:hypothetical protein N7495_009534 [Penicillium taxi]|uniref:uncharacterized protein n=1 Tax=Penicillium taxi TaxID=168475 RepID=UPI002545A837|nr:uncharacterized protein N7495_009534 [Penicillium taxi]KAJ5885024.1 hypothetical protein N7495_009534 [Penicillium taxi]